jgi:acylaminoacyl-peptidase
MNKTNVIAWAIVALTSIGVSTAGQVDEQRFNPLDVFQLEHASDPRISPDGQRVVYVRNFMDIMKDRRRSNLWIVDFDGSNHRPLTTGNANDSSPRWSPDGSRLLYASSDNDLSQLFVRWMDTGQTAKLTQLTHAPSGLSWSPDGKWIAFSMLVPAKPEPFVEPEGKPQGAEWAEPARVIRKLTYRSDGQGYLEDGYRQLFVLPADGGTPRQVTSGEFNHGGTADWLPDGKSLVFSANRHEDWEYDPKNTEVYRLTLSDGTITALTDRYGPDGSPVVSPDGKQVAYLGYHDRHQGYQVTRLHVMNIDGSSARLLTEELDRSVQAPDWSLEDGRLGRRRHVAGASLFLGIVERRRRTGGLHPRPPGPTRGCRRRPWLRGHTAHHGS